MSSRVQRSSRKGVYHSQFYRDLSSPMKLDFAAQSQPSSSSYSSPWRHTFDGPDPPPPPILSLEERHDFPADGPPPDHEFKSPVRTSSPSSPTIFVHFKSTTPVAQGEAAPSNFQTPGSSKWRSPPLWDGGEKQQEKSPVLRDGQQRQERGLFTLSPPPDTVRPENQANGDANDQNWVIVYGFTPADTNLVLREFEKCGTILKHVPGPCGSNWMHIWYQNTYDVKKALQKNGMQISATVMVGVKPLDPLQCHALTEKAKVGGFMVLPPRSPGKVTASTSSMKASSRPYYLQQPNEGGQHFSGAIASPSRSTISRIIDLIFGI